MTDVIALGDINVDIIAHFATYPAKGQDALAHLTEFHCGGSAANAAMALARMGIAVSLIGRVGPDSLALKALNSLNEAGVIPTGLQRDPAAMTGLMYVVVTPDGERTILGHRGANVFTDPEQIREEDFYGAKLFHLSGYALLADPQRTAARLALEMALRHRLTVTLDPGMSVPLMDTEIHSLLPYVSILLPNLAEAQQLSGLVAPAECAQALLQTGIEVVAVKLAEKGCLVATREEMFRVPGFVVNTRDSTGAGDYYGAGFIAGFLGGLDWHGCAVLGNAMGAMAAARVGAGAAVPSAQEVLCLLDGHRTEPYPSEQVQVIQRVVSFVTNLATEPQEEGRPWWR
jgi:ribokinase